ncbi:MAG: flagellar basal body rod protein FlgC [Lachnospiraceae bacterium]|nr:flagellar basal body rod protein FlgC [Lachnospiraceae bacterium]
MSIFNSFNINSSGMTAERYRMDVIAENVANANTTRTKNGEPYRRKIVTFEERGTTPDNFASYLGHATERYRGKGVRVAEVTEDDYTDMHMVYDPSHPDADENGYVLYPNVNIVTEMTNLIDASRGYEANATAFNASKAIAQRGLQLGGGS